MGICILKDLMNELIDTPKFNKTVREGCCIY